MTQKEMRVKFMLVAGCLVIMAGLIFMRICVPVLSWAARFDKMLPIGN